MKLGLIFSIAAAIIGDFSGKYLAEYQPEKLAAAEWHFETEENSSLIMYGILDDGEVKYAIEIPYALSILAHGNPFEEVIGLDQFSEDEIPPLYIHYLFDIMVTIGMWLAFLSALYVFAKWRNWSFVQTKWFRWLIVAGGPLAMIAIEAGWWMAEVGRQPWVLRGSCAQRMQQLRVAKSISCSSYLLGLYLILGVGSVVVLATNVQEKSS